MVTTLLEKAHALLRKQLPRAVEIDVVLWNDTLQTYCPGCRRDVTMTAEFVLDVFMFSSRKASSILDAIHYVGCDVEAEAALAAEAERAHRETMDEKQKTRQHVVHGPEGQDAHAASRQGRGR